MPVDVRPADAADLPQLVALLGVLFSTEREFRPDPERQRRGLERILGNPATGTLFVARIDGRDPIVGMCNLLHSESTFLGGPVAWLEDVVVAQHCRGRGVGSALLDHVKTHARSTGLLRLTLLTDHDNDRAIRLYERAGFVRSTMLPMRLVLAQGPLPTGV